jgi:ubiquinone/menaquinone biosynthesis C-methylase UbiE
MPRLLVAALLTASVFLPARPEANTQLGARPTHEWIEMLEAPDRVASLRIDYLIASLALAPGQIVADIGAGPGVISLPMARAVAPGGKVYAVEVNEEFLEHIREKARVEHVTNVVPILGEFTDPKLPARDIDVALFHDVLHHIQDRPGYLKTMASYLKQDGRMAVVDMPGTGPHREHKELVITPEQVDKWMVAAGFERAQRFDGLPDSRWFIVYRRKA